MALEYYYMHHAAQQTQEYGQYTVCRLVMVDFGELVSATDATSLAVPIDLGRDPFAKGLWSRIPR